MIVIVKIYDDMTTCIKLDHDFVNIDDWSGDKFTQLKNLYETKYNSTPLYTEIITKTLSDLDICINQIKEKHSILDYSAFHVEQEITCTYNKFVHYIACKILLQLRRYKFVQKMLLPVNFYTQ